uniref:Uncharacterized protein n=1 Tax=Micrurus surinamensis TaxID=129470 RepID=A0A2D4NVF4_MICSU
MDAMDLISLPIHKRWGLLSKTCNKKIVLSFLVRCVVPQSLSSNIQYFCKEIWMWLPDAKIWNSGGRSEVKIKLELSKYWNKYIYNKCICIPMYKWQIVRLL